MRLIGDIETVVGFGLAGVQGTVCDTREQVIQTVEHFRRSPDIVLIVFSAGTARLAPDVVAEVIDSAGLPVAVVLPDAAGQQEAMEQGGRP